MKRKHLDRLKILKAKIALLTIGETLDIQSSYDPSHYLFKSKIVGITDKYIEVSYWSRPEFVVCFMKEDIKISKNYTLYAKSKDFVRNPEDYE